jgi:YD repeat-containing protein
MDGKGRLVYTINAAGQVQEYRYNERGNTQQIISYATPIILNPQQLPTLLGLAQEIVVNTAKDRGIITYFNAAGQLQYTVDGENGLSQYQYDAAGRLKSITCYYLPITDAQIENLLAGKGPQPIEHPQDRTHYQYCDDDNHITGSIIVDRTNKGYLQEQQRNAVGQRLRSIGYATPMLASTTLAQTRPLLNIEDAIYYFFRNARGQRTAEINPEYRLTLHQYLAGGLKSDVRHFAQPIDPTAIKTFNDIKPILDAEDQRIDFDYDLGNRIIRHTEQPLAQQTVFAYDLLNDVSQRRDHYYRYDGWSQLTAHLEARAAALLVKIQTNPDLTPEQKTTQIAQLWQQSATRHTYELSGLRIATINPVGSKTVFYYTAMRQVCATLNPMGALQTQDYNAFDDKPILIRQYVNTLTDSQLNNVPGGYITDAALALFKTLENTVKDSITIFKRDRRGLTVLETDPENYQTVQQYNAFSECVKRQQPLAAQQGCTTSYDYEARGLEITATRDMDGLKLTVQRSYNLHRKVRVFIDEQNNLQQWSYDRLGRSTQHMDAVRQSSYQTWDVFGRLLTQTDRLGNSICSGYHTAQRRQTITSPVGFTLLIENNVFGQKIRTTDTAGVVEQFFYEPGGELHQHRDALQRPTQSDYDLAGRMTQRIAPSGLTTLYKLNAAGQIQQQVENPDGLAITTAFTYDGLGREATRQDANGTFINSDYDRCSRKINALINPQTVINPQGLALSGCGQ